MPLPRACCDIVSHRNALRYRYDSPLYFIKVCQSMKSSIIASKALLVMLLSSFASVVLSQEQVEEIVVWASQSDRTINNPSPTSILDQDDFASINVATTEDVVKFEPSVVIRRRFIGDANGVMGMRVSTRLRVLTSLAARYG